MTHRCIKVVIFGALFSVFLHVSCATAAKNCARIIPGVDRMRSGWDITVLDVKPMDRTKDHGDRQPILDFTCNKGEKWINPKDPEKTAYDRPDQVSHIVSLPWGALDAHNQTYKHFTDVRKTMSTTVGVSVLGGLFGLSATYTTTVREITADSVFIEDVSSFVSSNKATFAPYWVLKLADNAAKLVERFPDTFEENPAIFAEFIKYYGTHYYADSHFGGTLRMYMSVQKSLYGKMNGKDIEANAGATFFNWLSVMGAHKQSTKKVHADFTTNTKVSQRHYGGQASVDTYPKWEQSVAKDPWLFKGTMEPLSKLIANTKKRAATERAIQVHVDKAYLGDLENQLLNYPKTLEAQIKLNGIQQLCTQNPGCNPARIALQGGLNFDFGCVLIGCEMLQVIEVLKKNATGYLAPLRAMRAQPSPPHNATRQFGVTIEELLNLVDTRAKIEAFPVRAMRDLKCPANDLGRRVLEQFQEGACKEAFRLRRRVAALPTITFPESLKKVLPSF